MNKLRVLRRYGNKVVAVQLHITYIYITFQGG